jgi:hypothetical protein
MATPLFSPLQETALSIRKQAQKNNSIDYASGRENGKL